MAPPRNKPQDAVKDETPTPDANGAPDSGEDGATNGAPESADDGVTVFGEGTVVEMAPPVRTRTVKTTLTDAQLVAFGTALVAGKWAGTGETFEGENPDKAAGNKARVWRRELARYFDCPERDIRTRVWETAEGSAVFTCAVKFRDGVSHALPAATPSEDDAGETGEDDSATDDNGAKDAA